MERNKHTILLEWFANLPFNVQRHIFTDYKIQERIYQQIPVVLQEVERELRIPVNPNVMPQDAIRQFEDYMERDGRLQ